MSMLDIDGALIQAYVDLGMGLSTAYEGVHFDPPKDGTDWASVFIVPATIDYNSLGNNGEDIHIGFMQIDFNVEHGVGRAALLGYAQQIRDEFTGGKGYTQNSQNVRIDTVDRTAVRESDGWMTISVTVNWEATTIRPTI
jgi:hypothetical protein